MTSRSRPCQPPCGLTRPAGGRHPAATGAGRTGADRTFGLAFYPRETIAVLVGVVAMALVGGWLLVCSARGGPDVPGGALTVTAFVCLGVVALILMYGDPVCGCLP